MNFRVTHLKIGIWVCFFFLLSPENIIFNAQPTTPAPAPDYPFTKVKSSTGILVMVLVIAFFVMGLLTLFLRHDGLHSSAAMARAHPFFSGVEKQGLSPTVIDSFPVFVYAAVKDLKFGKGSLECAVCLCDFEDDDTLRLIPKCDHVFHPECIDGWLANHVTCPVCRANLSPETSKTVAAGSDDGLTRPEYHETVTVIAVPGAESSLSSSSTTPSDVAITVDENSRRKRICGKFPRSHSTGHSLSQLGESSERYTLRLPAEVSKQLAVKGKLKRTRSYDAVLGREEESSTSSRAGKRTGVNRWVFTTTPPFVSRGGSVTVKSPRKGGEGDGSSNGRTLLMSIKASLDWLNLKGEPGQQSSNRPPV